MIRHQPTGWNTWDFRGFNRLVYLDKGRTRIIVEYAIWDEDYRPADEVKNRGGLHHGFRWTDATHLGPHAPLGLPARLEFTAGGARFRAEAEEEDGVMRQTVTPLAETKMRIVFLLVAPIGETTTVKTPATGTFAGCGLEFDGAMWPHNYFLNVAEPYAIGQPGRPATLRVTVPAARDQGPPTEQAVVSRFPVGTFQAFERFAVAGEGSLADAPQAMMQAVTWNTLFDMRRHLVSSPVSRDWCYDWKGVLVFCWDTYLVGAFASYASAQLAQVNFETVSAAIAEMGHVPNYYMAHGAASRDRSMCPLGSYMIWKTQCAGPDTDWLKTMYPLLARWHRFWMKNRDGNGDGLLEWGTNAEPRYEFPQLVQDNPTLQHSAKCAMYESGLDNSPMYDDVPFNERANTLELADVGLNSFYAMDCEALANMAESLGRSADAARYRKEYEAIKRRINEQLWDEEHGIYANRHWAEAAGPEARRGLGRFSARWSPTSFFPLIAGVAPPDRAERMVREHLLNEREFWGPYVVPSIARSDPAYPDNDYWRGRIWPPFNFLVCEGLRRYRFDDVATEFATKCLNMFMENWRADGGVYENYNADTGRGADVWNAARLYHWGGLLAFIAMQELIDVEPAGWLRIGSLKFPAGAVRRVRITGNLWDVELGDGLRAFWNRIPYLDCSTRAIVRIPLGKAAGDKPMQISAAGGGRLTLRLPGESPRPALVNGGQLVQPQVDSEPRVYSW